MSKRWAIACDPKLLERIARQEQAKGEKGVLLEQRASAKSGKRDAASAAGNSAVRQGPSQAVKRAKKVAENNQDSRKDSMSYCAKSGTLTIVFAGAQLLSLNTSLRMHDAMSTQLKSTWLKRIEALTLTHPLVFKEWRDGATFPLIVEEVYATGEGSCLDVESVTAACKPIIDSLVRIGYVPDDSPQFIAQPIGYTYKQKPHGVVICFRPAPRPWGAVSDATMAVAKLIPPLS